MNGQHPRYNEALRLAHLLLSGPMVQTTLWAQRCDATTLEREMAAVILREWDKSEPLPSSTIQWSQVSDPTEWRSP